MQSTKFFRSAKKPKRLYVSKWCVFVCVNDRLMTYPLSMECSEHAVVPFHKKKL